LDKTEKWGVRKLAYRLAKFSEGQYILFQFSAKPETVKEIERRLRVADLVLKFITVRIDEKLKRIEKRRKQREKRAARKPPAPVSAPAVASPLAPPAPATPVPGAPAPAAPTPERT
jgi:small subunit ribosomal protein S6